MSSRYGLNASELSGEAVVVLHDRSANFSATIAPRLGGALVSLTVGGTELLHRGGVLSPPPAGAWVGGAPVLVPAVGRCAGGATCLGGGSPRPMPLHGFARGCAFELTALAADEAGATAAVRLTSSHAGADAAAAYPFVWSLTIAYTLAGGVLSAVHTVAHACGGGCACAGGAMPAAIGNHITFAYPWPGGGAGAWADGLLRGSAARAHSLTSGSLLDGATAAVPELQPGGAGLPLTAPLATNGVLGLDCADDAAAATAPCVLALVAPSGARVELAQTVGRARRREGDGAAGSGDGGGDAEAAWRAASARRFFVCWGEAPAEGAAAAGFICLEPWLSGPDSLNTRLGVMSLQPGEEAEWAFTVDVTGFEK